MCSTFALLQYVVLSDAHFCWGYYSEQAHMKDLAIVLCRMPFLEHNLDLNRQPQNYKVAALNH